GLCRHRKINDREFQIHPARNAPVERSDADNAAALEQERHTGAGSFVGSRTVEDDLAVPGNVRQAIVEMLGRDPATTGDGIRSRRHIELGAQVDDRDLLAGVELAPEVLRGDPRDAKETEKEPATQITEEDVADHARNTHQ